MTLDSRFRGNDKYESPSAILEIRDFFVFKLMPRKNKTKIVFIDTNIFIFCAQGSGKFNLGLLKKILNLMDRGKLILLLPQNIQSEILDELEKCFKNEEDIKKMFSGVRNCFKTSASRLDVLEKKILQDEQKKYRSTKKIIKKIFDHKNTEVLELSNDLILSGIKRSSLLLRPHGNKKYSFLKDQDCIAFETVVNFMNGENKSHNLELIICTDDLDYFKGKEREELHNDILKSLGCDKVVGHSNPAKMLKEEFGLKFTKKQIINFSSPALIADEGSTVILPGPDYKAGAILGLGGRGLNVQFCPYCGKDISKELLELRSGMGDFIYDYQSEIMRSLECPYCKTRLNLG